MNEITLGFSSRGTVIIIDDGNGIYDNNDQIIVRNDAGDHQDRTTVRRALISIGVYTGTSRADVARGTRIHDLVRYCRHIRAARSHAQRGNIWEVWRHMINVSPMSPSNVMLGQRQEIDICLRAILYISDPNQYPERVERQVINEWRHEARQLQTSERPLSDVLRETRNLIRSVFETLYPSLARRMQSPE